MNPPFKVLEQFRLGWQKTKEHSGVIFPVATILVALSALSYIFTSREGGFEPTMVAGMLVSGIISAVLWLGALSIARELLYGRPATLRNIIPSAGALKTYFWAMIVSFLIIVSVLIPVLILALVLTMAFVKGGAEANVMGILGFPILIAVIALPIIIYISLRYFVFVPLIVIEGMKGVKNIFRRNELLTQGVKWRLIGLMLLWMLPMIFMPNEDFNAVAFATYLIVSLVVIPIYLFAFADTYRKLKMRADATPIPAAPETAPISNI